MDNSAALKNTRTLEDVLITNWAVYTCTHFRIRNSALITGANESGKSTIIDALTYAMFGITDFNIQAGAGEDERSVFSYVKGDTKDNEDRYLRDGQDITSYIAVDIHNPVDDTYLTEGVCIELYKDDTKTKARWFVVPGARIDDINFYHKNGTEVSFTPRQDLVYQGKPLTFYQKEEGIATFLRLCGLRLAQGGVRELRGKLRRLLACGKKKMDIDRFVRESVFEADDTAQGSLDNILRHKSEIEQLVLDLKKLQEEKELLQTVENGYLQYLRLQSEGWRQEIAQKKFLYSRRREADEALAQEIQDLDSRTKVLQNREKKAKAAFERADEEYLEAAAAVREGQRPITELKAKLADLESSRSSMEDSVLALKELSDKVGKVFADQTAVSVAEETMQTLSHAWQADSDEAAVEAALQEVEHKRVALYQYLQQQKEETGYQIRDLRRSLDVLNREIRSLQQNQKVLPEGMEKELAILQKEAQKAGLSTQLQLVCDLVNDIDPKWQLAAETFLGGRRFNVIAEPAAVPGLLKIIDEQNLYHIYLVLTNQMEEIPAAAPEGSLAARFRIANQYARKYINYTCGPLKCVETRQELNQNPRGAIMPNGMIARGLAASKMRPVKDLAFGRDAIEKQLSTRLAERSRAQQQLSRLQAEGMQTEKAFELAFAAVFAPQHYDLTAPHMLVQIRDEIDRTKSDLRAMENNPSARRLMDMFNRAAAKRENASQKLTDLQGSLKSLAGAGEEKTRQLQKGRQEEKELHESYERAVLLHPEEQKAADALYERQKNNQADSLTKALQELERRKADALNSMLLGMRSYNMSHAGYTADLNGAKQYIDRLDELRTKDIDETRNKIQAKEQTISDTFMRDFVEVIYARIRTMREQKDAINEMLRKHKFGDKTYSLVMRQRSSVDMKAFFTIAEKIDDLGGAETLDLYLSMNNSFMNDAAFADAFDEFKETVLDAADVTEYTDYRNYYSYDLFISDGTHTAYLSRSQGIYSGGGKQTPYFILLTAALMTSYRLDACCLRIAFIDEAFAAMDEDRIRSMMEYFNDNGLQVIYAAPDKTMHNIAPYVDTTCVVVKKDRQADVIDAQMSFG